ncbi:dihydrolipoyl dehydrogenase [Candidatus Calescamantes bacterium]|nr:dihydrolipoyl dehydrogenase [Candidatus Calescamantes bacterium]
MKRRVIVLGGGPGGYSSAIRCAQMGAEVILVEKEFLGGVCLNHGCIPTKTLFEASLIKEKIKKAGIFGWEIEEKGFQWEVLKKKKEEVVIRLRKGLEFLFSQYGIKWVKGVGKVINGGVEVGEKTFSGDTLILATGSSPLLPPAFKKRRVLTSREILDLEKLPEKLLIAGGGVIGCEFAYIFSSLGTEVTLVEMMERLLPAEDGDISRGVEEVLKKKGVRVITGIKVEKIEEGKDSISCELGEEKWEGEYILAALGRVRNTQDFSGLGIEMGKEGVRVNEQMETTVPGVFAVGDLTPSPQLAHVAFQEGEVAGENACGGEKTIDYRAIPRVIFTYPEAGSVGMGEEEAREKGYPVKTVKFPFTAVGKAHAEDDTEGWVKLVVNEENNEILGLHILSPSAGEILGEGIIAVNLKVTPETLADSIHPHPTRIEAIKEVSSLFLGKPLHFLK